MVFYGDLFVIIGIGYGNQPIKTRLHLQYKLLFLSKSFRRKDQQKKKQKN